MRRHIWIKLSILVVLGLPGSPAVHANEDADGGIGLLAHSVDGGNQGRALTAWYCPSPPRPKPADVDVLPGMPNRAFFVVEPTESDAKTAKVRWVAYDFWTPDLPPRRHWTIAIAWDPHRKANVLVFTRMEGVKLMR